MHSEIKYPTLSTVAFDEMEDKLLNTICVFDDKYIKVGLKNTYSLTWLKFHVLTINYITIS